jgi:hypothetical protein
MRHSRTMGVGMHVGLSMRVTVLMGVGVGIGWNHGIML